MDISSTEFEKMFVRSFERSRIYIPDAPDDNQNEDNDML
jgi:hypothetical protein